LDSDLAHLLRAKDAASLGEAFRFASVGEAWATSDIEFAFVGEPEVRGSLCDAFERSGLPYTVDLVDYERQSNESLRQAIDAAGRLLLEIGGDGDCLMTEEQIRLQWEDYHRALQRLQTALRKEPDMDGI
jgi:nucleotidyltransferase substrate-binding family protein